MRENATKIIEGHTYAVTQLPARQAERLFVRLLKLFGPSLMGLVSGALVQGLGKPTSKADGKGASIRRISDLEPALLSFFDRISEEEFDFLRNKLLEMMTVDGRMVLGMAYDVEYQGRLVEVLQAMWFSLEANFGFGFGGLLSAMRGRVSAAMTAAPAGPSTSPMT